LQFKYLDHKKAEFIPANIGWSGSYYTLQKKDWKVGDLFQLDIEVDANAYVYIFSVDANNKLTMHYQTSVNEFDAIPADSFQEEMNFETEELIHQGFPEGTKTVHPGKDSAYALSQKGKDHLIILYSTETLEENLEEIMSTLRESKTNLLEALYQKHEHLLIAPEYIKYDNTQMRFSVTDNPSGFVVPVILEVEAK